MKPLPAASGPKHLPADGGRLRIIGGRYRGRKLPVLGQPGLRPTSDRIRETLFNWLAPVITGARCLDLFAGSGALGFEAASRGAAEVVMIEHSAVVARSLAATARTLGADQVVVHRTDALRWLTEEAIGNDRPFDIVFLDPPFAEDKIDRICALLDTQPGSKVEGKGGNTAVLAEGARVYLESPVNRPLPELPADWNLIRDKRAGQVHYSLVTVHGRGGTP